MTTALNPLTYEDYLQFPEDGLRHELLAGNHAVTPGPGHQHQRIVNNLAFLLTAHLKLTGSGELYTAPIDVRLSAVDVVQPDLLVLKTGGFAALRDSGIIDGPPDLVIEVLSPTTRLRDETLKRKLYQRAGVSEYWLVDQKGQGGPRVARGERPLPGGRLLSARPDDRITAASGAENRRQRDLVSGAAAARGSRRGG